MSEPQPVEAVPRGRRCNHRTPHGDFQRSCILAADHEGEHTDGDAKWATEDGSW